jgi:SAM-dependent methyltransferase
VNTTPEGREFRPWPLQWQSVHVGRYWDWWSRNPALEHLYFSKVFGDALLDEIAKTIPLRGTLLDLGCGPGHLIEKALDRGVEALAVDQSVQSVAAINERLASHPRFRGAKVNEGFPVPVPDGAADIVTVIETVEHLDDARLGALLDETRRLVRKGGYVVVTTPHDEDLPTMEVMCPDCGCVFHQFQHVRSFTPQALQQAMEGRGFTTLRCRPLLFSFLPKWMQPFHRWVYPRVKGKLPHLMYIGQQA